MPCRAVPPPPPPPHSSLELLAPSPASLSNPLVYRLRTCCLQEFLPRLALVHHPKPSSLSSLRRTKSTSRRVINNNNNNNSSYNTDHTTPPHSSQKTIRLSRPSYYTSSSSSSQKATQLSILVNNGYLDYPSLPSSPTSLTRSSVVFDRWQPSFTNIPLSTLQSALAHRFLDWFMTQNDDNDQKATPVEGHEPAQHQTQEEKDEKEDQDVNEDIAEEEGDMAMVDGWVASHGLQWPEGDYYIAKKTFIREGVAHLKRGRRYIFVEPVLGPASSYLYPKWMDPEEEEEDADENEDEGEEEAGVLYHPQQHQQDGSATEEMVEQFRHDEEQQQQQHQHQQHLYDHAIDFDIANASSLPDHHDSQDASAAEGGLLSEEGDKGGVYDHAHAHDREDGGQEATEEHEEEGRAHLDNKGVSIKGEKKETPPPSSPNPTPAHSAEENRDAPVPVNSNTNNSKTDDENSAPLTPSTSPVSTPANPNPNNGLPTPMSSSNPSSLDNSSTLPSHGEDHSFEHHQQSSTLHEPYSPLLDSSTDGQDQFEYGLYELQFIPKIQYLLPQEFLPTRQSFIVHLDEDRPTLASPVPAHSKRSECRCQLMMRKVLMHRDLQQVWPVIPPVRTIAERQQEAEEEARMKEIKEKVQLQSMQWRKALMTQTVACG